MEYNGFIETMACTAAASFHIPVGAALAFSAIVIPQLQAPESDIQVTTNDISWIASLVPLMMLVGSLLNGCIVDRLGRLNTIRMAALPYSVGWACIAMAPDLLTLLLGRMLTGLSLAFGANPALVYMTEVGRPARRGALICLAPSFTALGMVLVYAQGMLLSWRTVAWISALYSLIAVVLMGVWGAESPPWLVSRGKTDKALLSLKLLFKNEAKAEQRLGELVKTQNNRRENTKHSGGVMTLLQGLVKPTGIKPMILLILIFTFQQYSGIYITIFYAVSFFKDMGASIDPYISAIGIGIVRLVIGILTIYLMKRFNKRPLFICSSICQAIFIFVSGYYTREISEGRMETSWIPIICVLLYMSMGVIGFMSIPWTMTAELFPLEIRGAASSILIAVANLIMFGALKVYPFLTDYLGGSYAVQWLFAAVSLLGTIFVFVFLPETYKKELWEIQDYFSNNIFYILSKKKAVETVQEEVGEEMVKLKETA